MSLADALRGIKETQAPVKAPAAKKPPIEKPAATTEPKPSLAPSVETAPAPAQRVRGKSANPDYEKVTLYTRRDLRRAAERKFEDEGGRDLSDLIEGFLLSYLGR